MRNIKSNVIHKWNSEEAHNFCQHTMESIIHVRQEQLDFHRKARDVATVRKAVRNRITDIVQEMWA